VGKSAVAGTGMSATVVFGQSCVCREPVLFTAGVVACLVVCARALQQWLVILVMGMSVTGVEGVSSANACKRLGSSVVYRNVTEDTCRKDL
jgi:hypothetical protein